MFVDKQYHEAKLREVGAHVASLEAALREIRDLPERKVPFPGTNYENDSARGYADALEDVREIIDRVLGKENT